MRLWCRLFFGISLCLAMVGPANADHVPRIVSKAYLGLANQTGPSAQAVDTVRGLVYQAFLGSRSVIVSSSANLDIVRSWTLPASEGEPRSLLIALSPAGDRLTLLRTSATSADIMTYNDVGVLLSDATFPYDGRSLNLVMTATAAFVARQDAPLLVFDGTLREVTSAPPAGSATISLVEGRVAYFSTAGNETFNLVLLDARTLNAQTTSWNGPSTASYGVSAANGDVYVASCGGLARIEAATGAVTGMLDTATVGCLTDVVISPDNTMAIAIMFNPSGSTSLVYVDLGPFTVQRKLEVPGGSGRLTPFWQGGSVFVTTFDYRTAQQAFAGVLDIAAGTLRALPYSVMFADANYGIAVGDRTLYRYDSRDDTWRAAVYGGAVNKTVSAAGGTTFAQIGEGIARIPSGATAPDVFYTGGADMVLGGTTLYSHDGSYVFVSDTNGNVSRALAPLSGYRYLPGMVYDAGVNKLVLSWSYQPRNALAQVGITLVDATTGAKQDLLTQSGPSIATVHDPVGHRVYAVTSRFNADGSPANGGELTVVDLQSGATTVVPVQGIALSSPRIALAFDAGRDLLAITDGANLAAVDGTGRQLWTAAVNGRALGIGTSSWIVGGDNSLALVDPATGRTSPSAQIGYQLTDVGMVNDLVFGFDAVSGAMVSAQPAANGLVFQVEGASLPPTSWETTPTGLVVGDRGGVVTLSSPHQGGGSRGNVPTFYSRWARADAPIISGAAQRSWTWGPRPWAVQIEPYAESVGGFRLVEYRDKTRMEITRPEADTRAPWYVTNGLLVQEMLSGRIQTGDQRFEAAPCPAAPTRTGCASTTPVAGDSEGNADAPTYADMQGFVVAAQRRVGQRVDASLTREQGSERRFTVGSRPERATEQTELVEYDATTQHNIPRVFWEYMNQRGLVLENGRLVQGPVVDALFAFGRPVTEPYWTQARVGGETKDVLIQLFERRVLTYTPTNPAQFQVEMGNVGQHYYAWRYGEKRW